MASSIDNSVFSSQGFGDIAENVAGNAIGPVSPFNDFGRYMTGSRAIIKINDKLFGFAFGVSYNINTTQQEIWTIDDYTPFELAPQRVTVEGTMSLFHIPGKGPTKELVQADVLSFLFHKHITIKITDQLTGNTIFETQKAAITSKRQDLRAGELSTIELSWKAIGWADEVLPRYPTGHDTVDPEPALPFVGDAFSTFTGLA